MKFRLVYVLSKTFSILFLLVQSHVCAQQTTFKGPHIIPGIIEAEDFDDGGQDISYHDNEIGINPKATVSDYRKTSKQSAPDVEVLSGGALSNGHKVGWMNAGDWLEYTFEVENDDSFFVNVTATARNASAGKNKGYRVLIDGNNISGEVQVNPKKDWFGEFVTQQIEEPVNLKTGSHVLRLEVFSTIGSVIDLDFIEFTSSTTKTQESLTVNSLIKTNSVLQRNTEANIWGKGEPGNTVTVVPEWDKIKSTIVDDKGNWEIKIPTFDKKGNGPFKLEIKDKTRTFNFNNILLGEVWVCAGQSNMDQPLGGWGNIDNSEKELKKANFPNLRVFKIRKKASYDPLEDVEGFWAITNPKNAKAFSAVAYFFARELHKNLKVPVGVIVGARGDSDGESWIPANFLKNIEEYKTITEDLEKARLTPNEGRYKISHVDNFREGFRTPETLFNGTIAPILPYTIKGSIWYQGESNSGKAKEYNKVLEALTISWRKAFKMDKMPFYIAQICPWGGYRENTAELREAQFLANNLPFTGVGVNLDLGQEKDLHPKFKRGVGERLALLALKNDYKKNIVALGPTYKSVEFKDKKAILTFSNVGSGLKLKKGDKGLFEIAGDDNDFKIGIATVVGNKIEVKSDLVPNPTQVRYAWKNWIAKPTLYNKEGLPSSSFRTTSLGIK